MQTNTRFFVDSEGRFVGSFGDGAAPSEDATEVMVPPPHGAARWTGSEWIAPSQAIYDWRTTARLERGEFVAALLDAEILSGAEAIQAAKGDWPDTFGSALATLPVDPVKAQVQWGAATSVARLNPLFLAVLGFYAATHGLTDAQAEALGDTIFGWTDPI